MIPIRYPPALSFQAWRAIIIYSTIAWRAFADDRICLLACEQGVHPARSQHCSLVVATIFDWNDIFNQSKWTHVYLGPTCSCSFQNLLSLWVCNMCSLVLHCHWIYRLKFFGLIQGIAFCMPKTIWPVQEDMNRLPVANFGRRRGYTNSK